MNYPEENSPDQIPKRADDVIEDRDLKTLLNHWKTPEVPGSLDQRIFTAYRRQYHHRLWWRRWLTESIRLPIPLAATTLILLCATSYLAMRKAPNYSNEVGQKPPTIKVVEVPVPVVQEKIVTRVVYRKTGTQKSKENLTLNHPSSPGDLANFRPVNEIKIVVSHGGEQ